MKRPRFIAEQARNARGLLGKVIALIMSHETKADNRRAIEALGIEATDNVLDVGCGHGSSLPHIAKLAPRGKAVGADPSKLMASIAARRCQPFIASGRIQLTVAEAGALPFPDELFDKALCVHVVYFWPELMGPLREIARVLKPGGKLALLFRSELNQSASDFPVDIYRFPALDEMRIALGAAGFAVEVSPKAVTEQRNTPLLLVATRIQLTPDA